jgi:quercetin dioxygenase-like cupin family protein
MMRSIVAILALVLSVGSVYAAENLPDGVTMVVLKELPAPHLPGIAKVKLMEMRIAPGAKLMNHKLTTSGFCTSLQGTFTFEVDGKTHTRFAGETWMMKKGPTVNMYNRGTVEHVQRMWVMVEDDKSM